MCISKFVERSFSAVLEAKGTQKKQVEVIESMFLTHDRAYKDMFLILTSVQNIFPSGVTSHDLYLALQLRLSAHTSSSSFYYVDLPGFRQCALIVCVMQPKLRTGAEVSFSQSFSHSRMRCAE